MLRITRSSSPPDLHWLRVEGRLVGDWVRVLEGELTGGLELARVTLDLSGVEFADPSALLLLRNLRAHGVTFAACSPLLDSLLGGAAR